MSEVPGDIWSNLFPSTSAEEEATQEEELNKQLKKLAPKIRVLAAKSGMSPLRWMECVLIRARSEKK